MEVTYDYYRIFYYVAKYRSFSKAAVVLMSNQPNISRFMNNLESQLGCRLFVRSNRGVTLTSEGQKLYRHVCVAYQHLQAAELELTDGRSLERGIITISASEIALHLLLLPVLSRFHHLYPGIRLRISNHSTPQAIQAVKNGLADFAVVSTPTGISSNLTSVFLMKFPEILIGGCQYASLADRPVPLSLVSRYPLVCLGKETTTYEFYSRFFLKHDMVLRPDIEAATIDQILPMIIHGLGIGFLPEELAHEALSQRKVLKIPLIEDIPQREICMIEDHSTPLSLAANTLKQMLLEGIADTEEQTLSSDAEEI